MMQRIVVPLAFVCLAQWAWADTMVLQNNAEINGRATYRNGTFTMIARYRTGSRTIKLDRSEVRIVEFNARTFNPGEPPRDISIFLDHSTSTRNASGDPVSDHEQAKQDSASAESSAKSGHTADVHHRILSQDDFNPSTDDVVWLRTKGKVTGRLVSIDAERVMLQQSKKGEQFELQQVATILVAPN